MEQPASPPPAHTPGGAGALDAHLAWGGLGVGGRRNEARDNRGRDLVGGEGLVELGLPAVAASPVGRVDLSSRQMVLRQDSPAASPVGRTGRRYVYISICIYIDTNVDIYIICM